MRFDGRLLLLAALAVVSAVTMGCGAGGSYVWVDDVPTASFTQKVDGRYVIAAGDVLSVRVYNQEPMSARVKVRSDGKIAMPLVGEIDARGRNTEDLANFLATRLKDYVNIPSVAVVVEEVAPIQVTVIGEVVRQGIFNVEASSSLLQALATAGGPTEFAAPRVFVLRRYAPGAPISRIRFSYDALVRGEGRAPLFALQAADVVVVE